MVEKTPPGDASLADAQQRLTAAKAAISRKRVIDHYKILGLERKCPQEEVRWLPMLMPCGFVLPFDV